MDVAEAAAMPRSTASGTRAVTMGRLSVPLWVAAVKSAPANSRPRSDGLIGAASTRISTLVGRGQRRGHAGQREFELAGAPDPRAKLQTRTGVGLVHGVGGELDE